MLNLDDITNENNKKRNKKWPILMIGSSGSGKTNAFLNLVKEQDDIDKIYLYAKDLSEPKYEFSIKKREDVGINYCNDWNALIECFNTIDDVFENTVDYNPSRKRKVLIVFDEMMADIMSNQKFQTIIKELIVNISLVFYHSVLFFCSKRCEIKFKTLFDYENQQQKKITKYCN